jgi:hypothetical protein
VPLSIDKSESHDTVPQESEFVEQLWPTDMTLDQQDSTGMVTDTAQAQQWYANGDFEDDSLYYDSRSFAPFPCFIGR